MLPAAAPQAPTIPTLPPAPRTNRLAIAWRFGQEPQTSLDGYRAAVGDAFTLRMPTMGTFVFLADAKAIQELFAADPEAVVTGESNARMFEAFLGKHSLLNLDGAHHHRKRRLLMPPFHGERMREYGHVMGEITRARIDQWRVGQPFSMHETTGRLTLEVILRVIFGVDDDARRARTREVVLRFLAPSYRPEAALMALPALQIDLGRWSPWGRVLRLRDAVHREILDAIAERRRTGTSGRSDILSLLLDARDEDGVPLGDEELRDDLFTLLLVGHETTAAQLAWAFWALLRRPDVVDRIRAERREVLGDGALDPARLNQLPYLDAVVKEVTRLHPVTDGAARFIKTPVRIGPHYLPAGVMAVASTWLAHRHPAYWRDPELFRPERFLEERPVPGSYLPFGGGTRTCVGMAFAIYEMKVVLSEILTHAELRLDPGYTAHAIRRAITISPSDGVRVRLDRRLTPG